MKALRERILREGRVLPGGFLKVDGFLNHQLDPGLTMGMGEAFRSGFSRAGVSAIDKVVTAEVSGIGPALATAQAFGVPMVYARKSRPVTMSEPVLVAQAPSRTKGGTTSLIISPEYLSQGDRVLLIDDFLATGLTIAALADLIRSSGAILAGIGVVIEKRFQHGRDVLQGLQVPLVSLATITEMSPTTGIVLAQDP